jgi:16S rRNA processing protein RimM
MVDQTSNNEMDGEFVEVGKIGSAHGIEGEVRVFTRNPDWEGFREGAALYLEERDGSYRELTVENWRIANDFVIAKFTSLDDRGEAEKLRNRMLSMSEDELPELKEGEVYHYHLEGCEVYVVPGQNGDGESEEIGRVAGVFETPANDVMVVDLEGGDELYVPMFEGAIESIDADSEAVYLRPLDEWAPEGTEL